MRDTPYMPELQVDVAPLGMHRLGDLFPTAHLFLGMDPRRVGVSIPTGRDGCGLRNNQACCCTLGVILCIQIIGNMTLRSPTAREWGHEDPVWQGQRPKIQRGEKICQ